MRDKPSKFLESCRFKGPGDMGSDSSFGNNGAFAAQLYAGYRTKKLHVVVSDQLGWDHISVSCQSRCPTWEEMEYVRSLFFRGDETVIQFSVPRSKHINVHPYCLHLWRQQGVDYELPPASMVGPLEARQ